MGDCYIIRRGGGSAGAGGTGLPKFDYEGVYQLIDDGYGDWRIKFLTSGVIVFTKLGSGAKGIDVFLVGGGGGCGNSNGISDYLGAGGGGYTKTTRQITIQEGVKYRIEIGAGGTKPNASNAQTRGGTTSAFNTSVEGGYSGKSISGGNGGSGGASTNGATGGTDGGDGSVGKMGGEAGKGQGTTTREFGEASGDLYASGGYWDSRDGADNTGNGGGGVYLNSKTSTGGSGIVVIRNVRKKLKITQQPADVTVSENGEAVFTVKAEGTELSYQWQFQPASSTTEWSSTSATGATTSRLTIVASAYRNGYKYRCVITDGHGNSITSLPAVLTITA